MGVVVESQQVQVISGKADMGVCGGTTGLHTYTCISIYVFCFSVTKWFREKQKRENQ